jgi:addiction module HigA family antidote
MIKSFRDKDTARVFAGRRAKKIPAEIVERAQAKLAILDGAESLGELGQPPSNMLYKLSGDRAGQWAIRINAQWRICFEFDDEAGDKQALRVRRLEMIDRDELTKEILAEERVYPPMHPGRVLELEWLKPLNMSVNQLAKAIGVPRQRLNEVVRGRRAVSADTALRLARWSGMRVGFWLGLQNRYDLEMAEWKDGERIAEEVQPLAKA